MASQLVVYGAYNPKTKHEHRPRYWDIDLLAERAEREPNLIFYVLEES